MLRFLIAADLHGYPQNLRAALSLSPGVDGVILAGDYELPFPEVREACGGLPLFAVRGNNDARDPTLPEELLLELLPGEDSAEALPERLRYLDPAAEDCPPRDPEALFRIWILHGHRYILPGDESALAGLTGLKFGLRRKGVLLSDRAAALGADLVIFGHSHSFWESRLRRARCLLINPGTIAGEPTPWLPLRRYAILELTGREVRVLSLRLPDAIDS